VRDGDSFDFGSHSVEVLETPGHTLGHIVYYVPGQSIAFVGDTLFAMGCGRLFEGSPDQMWNSLGKLMQWPDETVIYCAHEYTMANGKFALSVDPTNDALQQRMLDVKDLRSRNIPTVPTSMGIEKATNPFLRAAEDSLVNSLSMQGRPAVEVFAETRSRKDNF
jgi:hydroxyacylglutathione hydrolase